MNTSTFRNLIFGVLAMTVSVANAADARLATNTFHAYRQSLSSLLEKCPLTEDEINACFAFSHAPAARRQAESRKIAAVRYKICQKPIPQKKEIRPGIVVTEYDRSHMITTAEIIALFGPPSWGDTNKPNTEIHYYEFRNPGADFADFCFVMEAGYAVREVWGAGWE